MTNPKLILKNYGLYATRARLMILDALLRSAPVFDHADLMAACKGHLDRVTIWRTLHLFYEHNLLLKVPSSTGSVRYIFRGAAGREISAKQVFRQNSHLQLICQDCGKIISVDNFELPIAGLPAKFEPLYIDTVVNGKCSACAKKSK
ncbi:MAG TPA: transcriptional repressor [Puia sp.]|jgi:Fur family ferric uptake transcriptional regulator|nr:transcriptional repressor [Puia sp.]